MALLEGLVGTLTHHWEEVIVRVEQRLIAVVTRVLPGRVQVVVAAVEAPGQTPAVAAAGGPAPARA